MLRSDATGTYIPSSDSCIGTRSPLTGSIIIVGSVGAQDGTWAGDGTAGDGGEGSGASDTVPAGEDTGAGAGGARDAGTEAGAGGVGVS